MGIDPSIIPNKLCETQKRLELNSPRQLILNISKDNGHNILHVRVWEMIEKIIWERGTIRVKTMWRTCVRWHCGVVRHDTKCVEKGGTTVCRCGAAELIGVSLVGEDMLRNWGWGGPREGHWEKISHGGSISKRWWRKQGRRSGGLLHDWGTREAQFDNMRWKRCYGLQWQERWRRTPRMSTVARRGEMV